MVLNIQTCSVYQKDGCTFFGMQLYGECNTLSHSADRQTSYHELQQRGGTKGGGTNVPNFLPVAEAVWLTGSMLELGLR